MICSAYKLISVSIFSTGQLLDIMHPGVVPMAKVNWSAKQSFEFVANYKILQTCFAKVNIDKHVDVDRLIASRYMDNLEFMQWFKRFFEMKVQETGDYDAKAQRSKGKGKHSSGRLLQRHFYVSEQASLFFFQVVQRMA